MLALPRSQSFTAKYGRDVHSYIVGTKTKENKKERKKTIEPAAKKKIQHSVRKRQAGNKRAHKHFILGGRLMGLLPDSILEGVGDSLLTAADRYAYTVSVPRMYNIVGRERVKALCSKKWQEAWEAHRQQQATRAAQEKKKKAENLEKAKREYDSVGGTPFHGVRAIANKHGVFIACLKCYADQQHEAPSWL